MPVALLLLFACRDETVGPSPEVNFSRAESAASKPETIRPAEQYLFDVAETAPSFGGLWMDEKGTVHVWVAEAADETAARRAVELLFATGRLAQNANSVFRGIAIHRGAYSVGQLARWRDLAFDAMNRDETLKIASLDLDERLNRVRVGVLPNESKASVRSALVLLGLDADAIRLEEQDSDMELTSASTTAIPPTIVAQADTIVGGLGMTFSGANDDVPFLCTLGFVAMLSSGPRLVTGSHCSTTVWGVDGSRFRNAPQGRLIAYETYDAAGYDCGFRTCRGSDAGMSEFYPGIASLVGLIARLQHLDSPTFDLSINQSNPYWMVADVENNNMYPGFHLYKVGQTTGWVTATVTNTCDDYRPQSSNRTVTCQVDAQGGVQGGDSGGPLFWIKPPTTYQVVLAGITVARGGSGNIIFSPFQRIAANTGLTRLDVIHPSLFLGQPVVTGSVNAGYPQLTWPAVPWATSYSLYRAWYNYYTEEGSNGYEYVGSVAAPFLDSFPVDLYTGTSVPNFSTHGYVAYYLVAHNANTSSAPSQVKYFRYAP